MIDKIDETGVSQGSQDGLSNFGSLCFVEEWPEVDNIDGRMTRTVNLNIVHWALCQV